MLFLACVAALAAYLTVYYASWWRRSRDGLPGPVPLPLIGHPVLLRDVYALHRFGERLFRAFGHVAVRCTLSVHETIWVNEPEILKEILSTRLSRFDRPREDDARFGEFTGGGLITMRNGDEWSGARRLFQRSFSFERLARLVPFINRKARVLVERLHYAGRLREPIDVERECLRFTFDIICYALFGADIGALQSSPAPVPAALAGFEFILRHSHFRAVCPVKYWRLFYLPSDRKYTRHIGVLEDLIRSQMASHRAAAARGETCAVDVLWDAMGLDGGEAMPDDALVRHLVTLMFAGHDTTANMLAWAFYHTAAVPEEAAALRAEVDGVWPENDELDASALSGAPRALAVLQEALRLHPSAPIRSRELTADTSIAGSMQPAGKLVVWCPYALHRRPDLWPQPELFCPARFLAKRAPAGHVSDEPPRHAFAFLPFGAGPRRCIGEQLALLEGRIALMHVARACELRTVPGAEYVDVLRMTLSAGRGVPLVVTARHAATKQSSGERRAAEHGGAAVC